MYGFTYRVNGQQKWAGPIGTKNDGSRWRAALELNIPCGADIQVFDVLAPLGQCVLGLKTPALRAAKVALRKQRAGGVSRTTRWAIAAHAHRRRSRPSDRLI